MTRSLTLTGVHEPVENGWIQARIVELPAVITAARSLEEAKALLLDALGEYLLSLGQATDSVSIDATAEQSDLVISLSA